MHLSHTQFLISDENSAIHIPTSADDKVMHLATEHINPIDTVHQCMPVLSPIFDIGREELIWQSELHSTPLWLMCHPQY